ncbi:hypothetical protein F4775DRAFT_601912 [Biscogniauxia sp. FL1348]|nr:hypothetical protein F4775DRAFT_601912 [Biscogniauxia sp. FL1348]
MTTPLLSGWAIRRSGSCLLTREVDCGVTSYCRTGENCTANLAAAPFCANSSWIMYNNAGYFCCEEGQVGYNNGNTDGCATSTADIPDRASALDVSCTPSAGVIAGSVVDEVTLLAVFLLSSWFLYQRGSRRGATVASARVLAAPRRGKGAPGRTEIDGNSRSELPHDGAATAGRAYELF